MSARIYQPAKPATQSGAGSRRWLLEYEPEEPREIEPLMGWTSSGDMRQQVRLWFETREAALAYAGRNGIPVRVSVEPEATRKTISYSDNFKSTRLGQWTH